mmetsp:Transcript_28689/g.78894  ORF Transcript_28689/g.78894 Transcript_28689/m.78894 type:complete len:226 (-) Transcript_28689:435-1112(-)
MKDKTAKTAVRLMSEGSTPGESSAVVDTGIVVVATTGTPGTKAPGVVEAFSSTDASVRQRLMGVVVALAIDVTNDAAALVVKANNGRTGAMLCVVPTTTGGNGFPGADAFGATSPFPSGTRSSWELTCDRGTSIASTRPGSTVMNPKQHPTQPYMASWRKNLWFPKPTQFPIHGQWWSILRTHIWQIVQWCARSGRAKPHFLQRVAFPGCHSCRAEATVRAVPML